MKRILRVIEGSANLVSTPVSEGRRRTSAVEAAYQHFRLDRQGSMVARPPSTTTTGPCCPSSPGSRPSIPPSAPSSSSGTQFTDSLVNWRSEFAVNGG